jgi:hypothetical protein
MSSTSLCISAENEDLLAVSFSQYRASASQYPHWSRLSLPRACSEDTLVFAVYRPSDILTCQYGGRLASRSSSTAASIVRDPVFCRIDPGSKRVWAKPFCSLEEVWLCDCACDEESGNTRLEMREVRLMAGRFALQCSIERRMC